MMIAVVGQAPISLARIYVLAHLTVAKHCERGAQTVTLFTPVCSVRVPIFVVVRVLGDVRWPQALPQIR